MKNRYNLDEVAMMTGLTTRTLRTYMKNGFLTGEMKERKWTFTVEHLKDFFASDYVMEGVKIKSHGIIHDFIKDNHKDKPSSCFIYDLPESLEKVDEIAQVIASDMEHRKENIRFSYYYNQRGRFGRIILSGDLKVIHEIIELIGKIVH